METLEQLRRTLQQLPSADRLAIRRWLGEIDRPGTDLRVAEPAPAYVRSDPPFMTLEEFFEFERKSEIRHEYVDGVVFAISGPSVAHERIRHRLVMSFGNQLRRGPCEVFSAGMQLLIQRDKSEICYYPDLMIDCQRAEWGKHFVRSPKLVLEILSPSTQLIDRREKFHNYRLIDSVEEYALVAQEDYQVTIHRRVQGWRPQIYAGLQAAAEFRSIDLTVPLIEAYDDVLAAH